MTPLAKADQEVIAAIVKEWRTRSAGLMATYQTMPVGSSIKRCSDELEAWLQSRSVEMEETKAERMNGEQKGVKS